MSSRKTAIAFATLLGLTAVGSAHAGTVTGNLTVTSDYLFRGITQTGEDPALQGTIEYAADSGLYIGGFGSSISWLSDADPDISSSVEFDVYGGYRGALGDSGVKYDLGAIYYAYPGDFPSGFNSADTTELYAGLSYGLFSAKYFYSVSDLFGIADSNGSSALEVAGNWEFVPTWTLNGAAGKQWVENLGSADYGYWRVGVTKAFADGFSVAAAYNDEDLLGPDETYTLTVSKSF
ncbi:MAG: TorF family putative porin [Luteimonas sp.]